MHRRLPVLLSSLVVGSVALGACTSGSSAPPVQTVPGSNRAVRTGGLGQSARPFEQFGSCEELLGYARAEALERVTPWGFDEGMWFAEDSAGGPATTMAGAPPAPTAAPASEGDGRSSATNTQEAGVDEGDLVETDGRYVYAVENGTLQVVDTTAGKLVGRLDLGAATHQLLLDGSRLTVVTSTWPAMGPMPAGREIWPGPSTGSPTTLVRVVDVTDPASPAVASETELEGSALATRAASGQVRIVVHTRFADRLPLVHPNDGDDETADKALDRNREIIETSPIEAWLPRLITTDANGTRHSPQQALACDEIGRPEAFAGLGVTWVATVDPVPMNPAVDGSAGVVADGDTVYASAERLYVATTRWPETTGDVVPNRAEPTTTAIHSFDLTGTGDARYVASGAVPGRLLNQFSLSEHAGVLRVAATEDDEGFGRPSESAVRILRADGDRLVEIGAVAGLGRTEQIHAVRFLGELGYVVTFRQTDPLYVLDLRDPTAPKRAGELKIPGYSAYLHPLGDGTLLGVGQDATADGRTTGAQLSLFDVHDPAAPARLSTLAVGGQVAAELDHHAFLWWGATGQAVVTVQDWDNDKGEPELSALVAQVSPTQIASQGSLRHPQPEGGYPVPVDRALVVDGRLVTISANGLLVSDLATLGQLAWVPFPT